MAVTLHQLLKTLVEQSGTDLHVTTNSPPQIRVDGKLGGLSLLTGPTGCGKSTTLAAMIDKINNDDKGLIVTIEYPVEYLHGHKSCIVNQRELFADTHSFSNALKSVLRQDPDVVLIG